MARARFRLLALPSNVLDSCSFYRCIGALNDLRTRRPGLHVDVVDQINWASLSAFDAMMLQRPTQKNQVAIATRAVQHGMPLWVDFDDNVFAVPRDNPLYETYMTPEVHENVIRICKMADVVTVSTAALAKVFSQIAKDVRVIPNGLMTNMIGEIPSHGAAPRSPIVMWRGSATHQRDVDTFTREIVDASLKHQGYRWLFQGYAPYQVIEGIGPAATSGKMLDQIDYFATLAAIRPKVFIVPLANNAFNRAKSNIAAIEAFYSGAVPVVPDWDEWQIPGAFRYKDRMSFFEALDAALFLTDAQHHERWRKGSEFIGRHLTIQTQNDLRNALVSELESLSSDSIYRANRRAMVAPQLVIEPLKATS